MGADRVAVYSFASVPWIRGNQRKLIGGPAPVARHQGRAVLAGRERFLQAGYEAIGMDHFRAADDELARARRERRLRRATSRATP